MEMNDRQKQLILAWFALLDTKAIDGIWGAESAAATKRLQALLGITPDGIFGDATQTRALQAMQEGWQTQTDDSWWEDIRYFKREEFACKCGRYCDGYPHSIAPALVRIADRARKYFGQPIVVVSGLRCRQHNAAVGGVSDSQHMYGEAADIYVRNVAPETVLAWFQAQSDVRYAYRIEGSDNIHFDIAKGTR